MAFGDFGGHGTNPNPLRTFASTKHSPLIGRDASQPGQWATSVISTKKCPKRVDNPGGVACMYVYIYMKPKYHALPRAEIITTHFHHAIGFPFVPKP